MSSILFTCPRKSQAAEGRLHLTVAKLSMSPQARQDRRRDRRGVQTKLATALTPVSTAEFTAFTRERSPTLGRGKSFECIIIQTNKIMRIVGMAIGVAAVYFLAEMVGAWTNTPRSNRFWTSRGERSPEQRVRRLASKDHDAPDRTLDDWRDFRAALVSGETGQSSNDSGSHEQWAYETGDYVERGSIVLSVPSSNSYLDTVDSLNSICYRKAIVLVLDAGPRFIQGIVLNRPTNVGVREGLDGNSMELCRPGHGELVVELGSCIGDGCDLDKVDGDIKSARWKVWFGGECGGLFSDDPQIICLHTVGTKLATSLSSEVLPGIYSTTFEGAESIVRAGEARQSDFWVFCGYVGWDVDIFHEEMYEEGLWHIVSADTSTVLEELNMLRCEEEDSKECDIDSDVRNAGLHVYDMLAKRIGLEESQSELIGGHSFGDLLLHEFATAALSFSDGEQSRVAQPNVFRGIVPESSSVDYDPAVFMESAQRCTAGTMLRASSGERSPYLFSDQGMHKSLILLLRTDEEFTEGVILNLVGSTVLELEAGPESIEFPVHYGGSVDVSSEDDDSDTDEDSTLFLHNDIDLGISGVGTQVGLSRFYLCTKDEVIQAVTSGAASQSFMAFRGISVWANDGDICGVEEDVRNDFFEMVPASREKVVWDKLLEQELLTEDNLAINARIGRQAWSLAGADGENDKTVKNNQYVFGTDVQTNTLADEASLRWMLTNILV